jgi:hypothetical protein
MNMNEALQMAGNGEKIKLPEWGGWWFIPEDLRQGDCDLRASTRVFCANGDVLDTPWFDNYKDRLDWYVTDGKLGFGFALKALESGKRVRRSGWKGYFLELQVPDANSKMTSPYIYIDSSGLQTDNPDAPKNRVPWVASQTDMLCKDWQLAD